MILINDVPFTPQFFPDGTLNMMNCEIPDAIPVGRVIVTWLFDNLTEQIVLYNLVNFVKNQYRLPVRLILPYVPNARFDRVKDPAAEVHTLKYFCKFINDLEFESVTVVDVHSPVTMSLLDRAIEKDVSRIVKSVIDEVSADYLFFPDKGALDRHKYLAPKVSFYGVKERNWNTGEITGYYVENPYKISKAEYADKTVLIVDDICSYGTTFYHAAHALKDMDFGDIYLYITHCENSIFDGKLINDSNLKHIFTTDSIYRGENDKITVRRGWRGTGNFIGMRCQG